MITLPDRYGAGITVGDIVHIIGELGMGVVLDTVEIRGWPVVAVRLNGAVKVMEAHFCILWKASNERTLS